jgi:riboflavin synthase
MKTIGIADTTFARADMGTHAERTLKDLADGFRIIRRTVPGIKDLPVACKKLLEEQDCDIVMALGMPGAAPIDKTCAHQASQGIIQVQLMTNKHILEVFVYEDEADNPRDLERLLLSRTADHCRNAIDLLRDPAALTARAGTGVRQGYTSVGSVQEPAPRGGLGHGGHTKDPINTPSQGGRGH